jgi:hypothetical protein
VLNDSLPTFDPKKIYFVRGSTGQIIVTALKTNRPCCVTGGGLGIDSQGDQGIFLRGTDAGKGGGKSEEPVGLPQFKEPNKLYLLGDKSWQAMQKAAQRDRTKATTNTGLTVQYTSDGTVLASK